jgi:hypothetical protein
VKSKRKGLLKKLERKKIRSSKLRTISLIKNNKGLDSKISKISKTIMLKMLIITRTVKVSREYLNLI